MDALALHVRHLGRRDYEPVWRDMQRFTDARDGDTPDELWIVEHPPVYTLGQAGKIEHVLAPGEIPVLHVDRGGQVTYHGPGQAVLYPLWDLKRLNIGIKSLVRWLEQSVIDALADWNINGSLREGAPGVFAGERKIASLGLRVRRGCSFHGLAVNVNMDLSPFERINPCGFAGLEMTQVSELGGPADWTEVADTIATRLLGLSGHQPVAPQEIAHA